MENINLFPKKEARVRLMDYNSKYQRFYKILLEFLYTNPELYATGVANAFVNAFFQYQQEMGTLIYGNIIMGNLNDLIDCIVEDEEHRKLVKEVCEKSFQS